MRFIVISHVDYKQNDR